MKKILIGLLTGLLAWHASAQTLDDLSFGTDSTLEVISWNIEWFPKDGQNTVDHVKQIIHQLDADIYALQEIDDYGYFLEMLAALPGWDGKCFHDGYLSLAYIYKEDAITVNDIYTIYEDRGRELPRPPLVLDFNYYGDRYIIINNHYKCCGDGLLELSDQWDEEKRRWDASNILHSHIQTQFPNQRVMVVGDLNDLLTDAPEHNVFLPFLDNPDEYRAADMHIAEGSPNDWSYPTWPSHLDHIIITNEIFEDFEHEASTCSIIRIDDYYLDGWTDYDRLISDHRPVGLRLKAGEYVAGVPNRNKELLLVAPNPSNGQIIFRTGSLAAGAQLTVYSSTGQQVAQWQVSAPDLQILWQTAHLPAGVYFARLQKHAAILATEKLILLR